MDKFRHNAQRDSAWIGKGVRPVWLIAAGIVALAFIATQLIGR